MGELGSTDRAEDHRKVSTIELFRRGTLDGCDLGQFSDGSVQQIVTIFGATELSHAEHDGELDVVAGIQKTLGSTKLRFKIMVPYVGSELDLLGLDSMLAAFGLFGLFVPLEDELAVVHDLAHWRTGVGRDFDQIEAPLARNSSGFVGFDNADLLAIGIDDPDWCETNSFVDAMFRVRGWLSK
jgi:hypothetical protein